MNSLSPSQELHLGDKLVSNNGAFTLEVLSNGALALYRTQVRLSMWSSAALDQPGGWAVMQGDGNFVAYSAGGVPYWASNTDGHPGAWVALLDDGNLVVMSPQGVLWQTNTVTNLNTPTIRYTGEGGYTYNETSERWKDLCLAFPCFMALQWPGYATTIVEDVIDGTPVVIQLWKGLCSKFLGFAGLQAFPGGIGAEVGIYRRIPGKVVPAVIPGLPVLSPLLTGAANLADSELWWPFPELGATIEFRFINPVTGEVVFSAGPERSYWLTKWMDETSYPTFTTDHTAPPGYTDYILEYTINGKTYPRWPAAPVAPGDLGRTAAAAWLPLLLGDDDLPPRRPKPPRPRRPRPRPVH